MAAVLLDHTRNLFQSVRTRLPTIPQPPASPPTSQNPRLRTAARYMHLRQLGGREADLERLVATDVVLTSSRDGVHAGRAAFGRYVRKVRPIGDWKDVTWNGAKGTAEARGIVRVVCVSVSVVAVFGFDGRGKINRIFVGRARKEGKEEKEEK